MAAAPDAPAYNTSYANTGDIGPQHSDVEPAGGGPDTDVYNPAAPAPAQAPTEAAPPRKAKGKTGNFYLDTYGPGEEPPAPKKEGEAPKETSAKKSAKKEPTGNFYLDTYGEGEAPPVPPPPPPEPVSKTHIAAQGIGDVIDRLGITGGKLAGAIPVLLDKISSSFMAAPGGNTDWQDAWFKHVVDPNVARDAEQQLPPGASLADRATYGVSQTAATIASMFVGGAAMGEAEATTVGGARLLGGVGQMTAPAATHAIDVGQSVLDATGDKKAAATAAVAAYTSNAAMGLVPGGAGSGRIVRGVTGAAIGAGAGEASRVVENQFLAEQQQAPFDPLNTTLNAIVGGAGAQLQHGAAPKVEEARHTVMDHAQEAAAKAAEAAGGDKLDQVVAATHAEATVGGHHDAAAVHATRVEAAKKAAEDEMANAQAAQDELQKDQDFGAAERQAGKAPGAVPSADAAFAQREQEGALAAKRQEAQKDRDFSAAKNQVGDQQVAEAEGAERGGAGEAKPTMADALPPEQVSALAALRERLAAQKGEPAQEPTVADRLKAQNPEDDFQQLGPETPAKEPAKPEPMAPRTVAERIAAQRKAKAPPAPEAVVEAPKAPETAAEASLPEGNPPAPTPQTLAERRQAALDAKMAAKVRGGEKPALPSAGQDIIDELRAGRAKKEPTSLLREGKSDLKQDYDPAERLLEEQVKRDADAAERNPGGKRPPLVQGKDPAARLVEEKAAEDAERGALAKKRSQLSGRPENAWFHDIAHQFGMTKDEATGHLQGVLDRLPPELRDKVILHESTVSARTHPDVRTQDRELLKNHPRAKGMYDPVADKVHLFANGHEPGDVEELKKTAIHELAHMGMRKLLQGTKYDRTMLDIANNGDAKIQAWMKDYAKRAGLNLDNPSHRAAVSDEYAAHLAEKPAEDPAAWQQIKDAVRAGLRKFGIVKEWNDNDIRRLLRNGAKKLGTDSIVNDHNRSLLSEADERKPARSPLADRLGGMTKEDQVKDERGRMEKIQDVMKDFGFKGIPHMLSVVDMRHMPDFVNPHEMPSVQRFIQANDSRRGRAGRLQQPAFDRLRDWSRDASRDQKSNATFGTVVHASTIAGVDPSKPFAPRFSAADAAADPAKAAANKMLQDVHAKLKNMFDALPEKWQQRYGDVRNDYASHRDATWKALEARINETAASADTKKSSLATLRRLFESSKVAGPYFPLFRTGDYWGRAMDEDGNHVSFTRFENTGERKQWIKHMQDLGFQTETGKKDTTNKSLMERIDPEFVRQIMDVTKDSPGLQDEIWQTYLKALPEMSMRKQFIHRQGRLGFSADAMRAYAHNMFHGSQQISRLEYGNRMDTHIADMQKQADALQKEHPGTMKAEMASAVASSMAKHNDWIKNPQNSPWTNVVNQLGFSWYLGFAPATAFRIHTQNSMLASPILAAKFGQIGATRELNRAALRWATSKGNLGDTLRGDERRAFDEAADQGMFTNTWASTLGAAANGMPPDRGLGMSGPAGRAAAATLRASQWLFNAIEHKNRMTTFLAAYRLGRMKGMEHDEAFQIANRMTWDAHLDYGNDNRARILQGDVMKVAGQFRQYPMGVAYRLARDFRNSLGNENLTPEQVSESRKQFAGILLRSFMYSGASGLPLMWAATAGINLAFDDKDKPFDAHEALHSYLQKEMGRTGADALMYGPVSAATGGAFSSGASYGDMLPFGGWYKPPLKWNEMNPQERISDAVQQVAGPAFGALWNAAGGLAMERNPTLALEHFVPPALQGPIKAAQYATQGATNLRGQQVMKPEEFDVRDLLLQAGGITPQKLADRRAMVGTMGEINRRVNARHAELMQALDDAVDSKDPAKIKKAQAAIDAFNKAQPTAPISKEYRSIQSNEKANATAFHGARLSKGLKQPLIDQYGGGEK